MGASMDEVAGASGRALNPLNCVFAARALRDFGDSFVAILLPAYLLALGFTPLAVGVLATASLSGSACLTIGAGLLGARYGYRRLLLIAAGLMVASGLAFAASRDYAVLLVIAFAGTINPSAGNVSVFVPLEHAALAREAGNAERTRMFARYSLAGALAAAVGALVAGAPEMVAPLGLDQLSAMRGMFVLYALLGVAGRLLYARLPQRPFRKTVPSRALGPWRAIVIRLAALFSLDAFAGGFVVQSLLALWLFQRFRSFTRRCRHVLLLRPVCCQHAYPVAARLSRRFGLVNTMVFTHIPSSLCLIVLAALAPSLGLALALLLIRAALSQMDVPARSSYVMAVVTAAERPAAASFTSVPRSLASAASPAMAGALFATSAFAWPLLICGTLKIIYDLLLLAQFRHLKPPEELRT